MKKILGIILLVIFVFVTGCKKNENKNINIQQEEVSPEVIQNEVKEEKVEVERETEPKIESESETKEVRQLDEINNPLVLFNKFDFQPIENVEVKSVKIENEENNTLRFYYKEEPFLTIEDIGIEITGVLNFCEPHNNERLFSSSFLIFSNKVTYCGVISFRYGYVKIYTLNRQNGRHGCVYYSGYSDYYVIEDFWIKKDEYYDYKTFKTVPAVYDGLVLVMDINTDEIVYFIDKNILHKNVLLTIDKIQYEADGFRIIIGNYFDSDEFTDFKLFTENEFHYEIYDTYSYE